MNNSKGSALLITLLIITLLVSITVEFAYDVYVNTSALSNWTNAQKASLIAKSGQTVGSKLLQDMSKYGYAYTDIIQPIIRNFGEDAMFIVRIEDENSKFNINTIIQQNGLTNTEALASLQKLFEYLNINPSLALAIADWIDPDQEPRLRDSENKAKNSFLWSVDELNFIPEIDNNTFKAMRPYITVYGDGKININTATLPVLISLHNDMTETLASRIIDYRETSPFKMPSYVQRVSGMESIGPLLIGRISTNGSMFRLMSTATVDEIVDSIESVVDTSLSIQYWREG